MNSLSTKRGFTLIELMISIALGMMIVYVATAGFRVASQSITLTNRLAIENDILRAGCMAANERMDFLTDFDDPDEPNPINQKLRGTVPAQQLPFTPMSLVFPKQPDPDPELKRGWDPQEPWNAADPRVWWHGSLAEKCISEMALGRYSIFSNSDSPVQITGATVFNSRLPPPIGDYGNVNVTHLWYNRQMWGLFNALGYYGFTDYMPQNTLFACYQRFQSGVTNQDGMPTILFAPGTLFYNGEGSSVTLPNNTNLRDGSAHITGLWRLTMATSFAVVRPDYVPPPIPPPGSPGFPATDPRAHKSKYKVGYAYSNEIERFNLETINKKNLLSGPSNWPIADVLVQHFIKSGRMINLCRVQLTHPITGATTALAFTSFSTTLRGARMQRRHPVQGGGWAEYDNKPGVVNDLTLDDTP